MSNRVGDAERDEDTLEPNALYAETSADLERLLAAIAVYVRAQL